MTSATDRKLPINKLAAWLRNSSLGCQAYKVLTGLHYWLAFRALRDHFYARPRAKVVN